ncbi:MULTISPECIES: hypothetical protein [unclassified Microcystis]|uniref:hypothetical protein n=1 Tax=unclassified Microcystis TaxID=2643300 RepID=UPI002586DA13|nr:MULTISPECIES: hypothetical protein [unclassified Microcystis]MCA2508577.1 hypothetical protein [Microcystis sp. M62BS1]MCA2514365.1 hypothetical protein [Microcystis sp. M59BS1]MCA2522052.1 hypothetical protein [Microcystis sp. M63BS1]MCA2545861.1 hypothetical protein [Microcystis sp. M55BS1]MCA2547619.1 hypothetical protein [Microcystis sp. M53BS1]MCA2564042.1 hypothetical protein [Microcystis sp. M40BS1]MCA2576965.1 hypothetical protein [Microcystis sp. M41BS1]MCA2587183.1 hypothetical
MGKWESGEVGKWGSGEVGKWGSGEAVSSPYHPKTLRNAHAVTTLSPLNFLKRET